MYLFFSESGCFRRKIMTQSNRFELASFFSENEVAIGRQRSCLPSKEWKKKKAFSFGFWLILVKHVEFGAGLSNPRWFVCERYLLTSLLLAYQPSFLSGGNPVEILVGISVASFSSIKEVDMVNTFLTPGGEAPFSYGYVIDLIHDTRHLCNNNNNNKLY